jgi:hypothetical protein
MWKKTFTIIHKIINFLILVIKIFSDFKSINRLTIVDFLFHRSSPLAGRCSLVRERINAKLFDNPLGDSDLFEAVRVQ